MYHLDTSKLYLEIFTEHQNITVTKAKPWSIDEKAKSM